MKLPVFLFLIVMPFCVYPQGKRFNINDYGAKADGVANNAVSIQKAIDQANAQGGGTVIVPAGKYLTGVINLKSNVTLQLDENAVLLSTAKRLDFGSGYASALITANGMHNIAITGKGTIDGNGDELLRDLYRLLRAGTIKDSLWQKYNPWHQMQPEEPNRPKLIRFADCNAIQIKGITIKNGLVWIQEYKNCSDIIVDSIKVESNTFWNNDGIDLVDCKDVKVTNSFFNADDDGICLKSSDRNSCCQNIYIANCTIRSSASAIKFGTASRGGFKNITVKDIKIYDTYRSAVALECVDGGVMENIDISNINAVNTGNAIFIRVGHRNKDSVISSIRGIHISNLVAEIPAGKPDKGYPMEGPEVNEPHNIFPSSIVGLPGHPVEDVVLENIRIVYKGNSNKQVANVSLDSLSKIPERPSAYPEFSMFGELPAWGFYARHAKDITFKNVTLNKEGAEFRSACVFDDVNGLKIIGIRIPQITATPLIMLNKCNKPLLHDILIPGKDANTVQTR